MNDGGRSASRPGSACVSNEADAALRHRLHAHILVPDVYAVAFPHSIACKTADAATDDESRRILKARQDFVLERMSDVTERIARMDAMGVDMQVLSSSHVHESTWWAEPAESLRLERMLNDHIARVVAANPARFVGLGGVPLPAPALAVEELRRCVRELGLKGVAISTTARDMELGDARLRPFWAAAQELGAIIYIHPPAIAARASRIFRSGTASARRSRRRWRSPR